MTSATKLLDDLRPDEIRARLDALGCEQKALRTLLRAALLRHAGGTPKTSSGEEGTKGADHGK